MNTILLLIKVVILIAIIFSTSVERAVMLAGCLLALIALPRLRTGVTLLLHSGYMRSPAGQIYQVSEANRGEALSQGFKELSIISASSLTGEYSTWDGK